MKCIVHLTILFVILLFNGITIAQSIPLISSEISADGKLEESVWQEIQPFKGFHNFFPINDGQATNDTEVRVFHDGKWLNISFVYKDTTPNININSLKRDNYGPGFHLSDHVGIIIDPYRNQNRGYFFALNSAGVQLDGLIANYDDNNLSWDTNWESGVGIKGTYKIYEMKIPLSAFSYNEDITKWNFQFYNRDAKNRLYTVWNKFERGFLQFDTRFLKPIEIENLIPSKITRSIVIPSITSNITRDKLNDIENAELIPSLDLQYKITDGLRIDATINPDFSQVEVDQQVTNLTRFNIIFPERRNFFIENSDMFNTLGFASDINPFYSRFIGALQDILFGLKLSGNISSNTRVGFLNVQSKTEDQVNAQNYSVATVKQQIGPIISTTGYFINRQANNNFTFQDDYNRVGGLKINYLSLDKKWSGFAGYSESHTDGNEGRNRAFSIKNSYQSRIFTFSSQLNKLGRNYFTDIGFAPRLDNYDALNEEVIRAGYTEFSQEILVYHYPKEQHFIQAFRPLFGRMNMYWDELGKQFETNYFYNTAIFFTNQMSAYINLYHDDLNLAYAFDPLRNGKLILPNEYSNTAIRAGFNSDYTRNFYGSINYQLGSFYDGDRQRFATNLGYRLLPTMSLSLTFEHNTLSFEEIGTSSVNLLGLTSELFFSNKINWTTYFQYNEQIDNININSRLQWEYKPLSFIYIVFSNNLDNSFHQKNWGISIKINRRLNI